MKVRAIPRGFDAEHVRAVGENRFCDLWDDRVDGTPCSGVPEVEVTIWHRAYARGERTTTRLPFNTLLCREHASLLSHQIEECISLVDSRDLYGTGTEP